MRLKSCESEVRVGTRHQAGARQIKGLTLRLLPYQSEPFSYIKYNYRAN